MIGVFSVESFVKTLREMKQYLSLNSHGYTGSQLWWKRELITDLSQGFLEKESDKSKECLSTDRIFGA